MGQPTWLDTQTVSRWSVGIPTVSMVSPSSVESSNLVVASVATERCTSFSRPTSMPASNKAARQVLGKTVMSARDRAPLA